MTRRPLRSWPAHGGRWLALSWLLLVVALAALAPVLPLPYPPAQPDLAHLAAPPLAVKGHWLGTDPSGRDVAAELIFGARTALGMGLGAAALAAALGALLGGAAGFWRNDGWRVPWPAVVALLGGAWWALSLPWAGAALATAGAALAGGLLGAGRRGPRVPIPLDAGVLGATALLGAVPRLVLVVALAGTLPLSGPGLLGVLVLTTWPGPARLVRAEMLRVKALPFVAAARALGLPAARVWWRQALPHACQPLRTAFPLSLAGLLALESTLSFLGIGLPPEVPSWGRLLGTARLEPTAWWLVAGPGGALLLTILALQYLARIRR